MFLKWNGCWLFMVALVSGSNLFSGEDKICGDETIKEVREKRVFVRPFAARYEHADKIDDYFLYPMGCAHREKDRLNWSCLLGLTNYSLWKDGGRFYRQGNFVPFYFFKRGFGAENDYAAVWPLGGTVKNFLGKERADWFLWPLWVKTQNANVKNYWFPWPLINYRCGQAHGFAFYPLGGHFFQKDVYDVRYFLWPLGYDCKDYKNQVFKKGFLPLYAYEKSHNVDDLSIVWPIWGHRKEVRPNYEEHRLLWPLWVQGRGEERYVNRWAPFYTFSKDLKCKKDKTWFFWPFFKQQNWQQEGIDIYQEQFLYFIFWHQEQKSHREQKFLGSKTHFWPIYSYWKNGEDHEQLQMLSPFEVFFPTNNVVRDIYTPMFNLYRYEKKGGTVRQSLLFGLIKECRNEDGVHLHCGFCLDYKNTKQEKSFSFLKGLVEYKKVNGRNTAKLFWIKLKNSKTSRCDEKML